MKYQTKLLHIFASIERDNRVKFRCVLATNISVSPEVKNAKLAILATGDIVISYTTKPAQEVEIRFNNLEALETLHYILETIRTFNPKNRVRDISIWKLNINLSTIEFDYIEETKIIILRLDDRVKTHMYKGEYIHKSFRPTDTLNLRTATDMAFRAMQFQPKPQEKELPDTIRLEKFDAAEYLNTAEECALYLKEFAGDENQILLISAITDVTRRSLEEVSKGNTEMGIEAIVTAMEKNGVKIVIAP